MITIESINVPNNLKSMHIDLSIVKLENGDYRLVINGSLDISPVEETPPPVSPFTRFTQTSNQHE